MGLNQSGRSTRHDVACAPLRCALATCAYQGSPGRTYAHFMMWAGWIPWSYRGQRPLAGSSGQLFDSPLGAPASCFHAKIVVSRRLHGIDWHTCNRSMLLRWRAHAAPQPQPASITPCLPKVPTPNVAPVPQPAVPPDTSKTHSGLLAPIQAPPCRMRTQAGGRAVQPTHLAPSMPTHTGALCAKPCLIQQALPPLPSASVCRFEQYLWVPHCTRTAACCVQADLRGPSAGSLAPEGSSPQTPPRSEPTS